VPFHYAPKGEAGRDTRGWRLFDPNIKLKLTVDIRLTSNFEGNGPVDGEVGMYSHC